MKRKLIIFAITIVLAIGFLSGGKFICPLIENVWLRITVNIVFNLLIGVAAYIAIKLSDMRIDFEWKNYKQYIIGIGIALVLSFFIAWLPALCGFSLVGNKNKFNLFNTVFEFFYLLLVIAPVEELMFRIYCHNLFVGIFDKHKWIGVIIGAVLFGLFHFYNGWVNVLFAFGFGLIWGFAKQYLKNLHYPGLVVSHTLYDFLNYIVRITIL